ncbi:MAG TPA: site-2 protease family protein [Solirubrobacteraceae bacterium]|jgi:Zn-dependent protease|nr:site-2 protease family protein [Solirubrobacteraceae bacterium]
MRGSDTLRLGQLFGIRIGVSRWWFLVLFFVIYALDRYFTGILPSGSEAFAIAVAGSLLFFATVVAHEFGHALVARHQGMEIEGIDLWALGGFTRTRGETSSPGAEFRLAAAGPLVNALVIAACVLAGLGFGSFRHFLDVALLTSGLHHPAAALVLIGWLALINAVLLAFNLLPAFPLDGGRIARALVWRVTGDPNRATLACARLGQGFGVIVIVGGLALAVDGSVGSGLWFVLIGLFLTQTARQAAAAASVGKLIRDVTVADIMDREPVTVPSQTTLLDAEDYFEREHSPWLAVTDDDGRYRGLLLHERVEHELRDGRPALTAAEISIDSPPWRIDASATLEAALRSDGLRRLGAIVAVDSDGILRGVLTLPHIRRAMNPSAAL